MQVHNNIIKKLNQYGIQVRPCWKLLHKLKQFSRYPQMNLSMSEKPEKYYKYPLVQFMNKKFVGKKKKEINWSRRTASRV